MSPMERTQAIADLAALELPPLLGTAGLDDFDEYINRPPLRSNDNEFTVYVADMTNSTARGAFIVVFQIQLHGQDKGQEYNDVIWPWLEEKVVASVVGFQERDELSGELWPMGRETQNVFNYYDIVFVNDLDDCDN